MAEGFSPAVATVTGGPVTVTPTAIMVVDPNNSTTAALGSGATFVGTATDLTNTAEIIVQFYGTPSTAQASLFFEFSPDAVNWDVSVPGIITDPTFFIPYPLIPVARYFRIRYVNDGGVAAGGTAAPVAMTVLRLNSYLLTLPTKEIARTLGQSITDNQPVSLTRSVQMGKSTDGTYRNVRQDGIVANNSTTTPLTSGATFTGAWFDAQGFAGYSMLAKTNVVSGSNGWKIEFSDDSAGANIRATRTFTYTNDDLNLGIRVPGPVEARYIRVSYTNGATGQANFFLETDLTIVPNLVPVNTLTAILSDATVATIGRTQIFAENTAGSYGNILRGDNGGLRVDVDALTGTIQMDQTAVTAVAAQFAATPLANRRSIIFTAPTSNTKIIAVGTTNAITHTSGSMPLGPGASWVVDLDDTYNTWYAVSESGTQRIAWAEVS